MMRPPKRSVQIPSGNRNTAPVRTGVAVRSPTWVESRFSRVRIGIPVTPNIVRTAKHAVNAQVVTNRTERFPDLGTLTSHLTDQIWRAVQAKHPRAHQSKIPPALALYTTSICPVEGYSFGRPVALLPWMSPGGSGGGLSRN